MASKSFLSRKKGEETDVHPGVPTQAKQPQATQQSIGGGTIFTPPFASHLAAAAPSSRNSSGGLNWTRWGQLYDGQERSPLLPVRASSLSLSQTTALPNHPAFSKNLFSHSGLDMLAETLACLDDGPTPLPAPTGHFLADGDTHDGASALLYSGGGGTLKGLTPISVNINSVASVQSPIAADAFPKRRRAADANGSGGGGGDDNARSGKKKKTYKKWTKEGDDTLRKAVEADTNERTDWKSIAKTHFTGSRTSEQCRARWDKHLDPEVSKEPFSTKEDGVIQEKVAEGKSFLEIAKLLPGRNSTQVQRRFDTIQPHKKGQWSESETKILIEKHREFGSKWTKIAPYIEGRTAHQISGRWYKCQEKQQKKVQEEVESEE